jgi:hypothetical protein
MRLWTLHPCHLDERGLGGLWREALLAKAVLQGRTRGYRAHPQLARFRVHRDPVAAINTYLAAIHAEARRRGYHFDGRKLRGRRTAVPIRATRGQVRFEWQHLQRKLRARAPRAYRLARRVQPTVHPLFRLVAGPVAVWEHSCSRAGK